MCRSRLALIIADKGLFVKALDLFFKAVQASCRI